MLSRRRHYLPLIYLLAMFMLIQPRMLFAAFVARSQSWLLLSLLSNKILKSFSAELLPTELVLPDRAAGASFFLGTGFCFRLLSDFLRFLSARSSSLSRSLWIAALPLSILTGLPAWCNLQALRAGTLVTSFRSLIKILNKTGPSMDPRVLLLLASR